MQNLIPLYPNLFRVIEIAKLGNHSISILFNPDYFQGFDDYVSIKTFCLGFFENFVPDGEIKFELYKPVSYTHYPRKGQDTLPDIANRIQRALQVPCPPIELDSPSFQLLNVAITRLGLSLKQVDTIKALAATIARLELESKINAAHIGEAIQYCFLYDATYLHAETRSISFGNSITIQCGPIDPICIANAIAYLNSLQL